jgi:tetratricopeptide (TPR) repeat protein
MGIFVSSLEDIRVRLNIAAGEMNTALYLYGKAEALLEEGTLEEASKVYEEAAFCLEKIIRFYVPEKPLHLAKADMFTKAGLHDRASLEYVLAWKHDREDQGLIDKIIQSSVDAFKDSEDYGPKMSYDVCVKRARTAKSYGSEKSEEYAILAIDEMKMVLDESGYGIEAYHTLGRLFKGMGRLEDSLDCFLKAYELDEEFERSIRFLIELYLEMGQVDLARVLSEKSIGDTRGFHLRTYDPDVMQAWKASSRGHFQKAVLYMEKAAQRFPEDEIIQKELEQFKAATLI